MHVYNDEWIIKTKSGMHTYSFSVALIIIEINLRGINETVGDLETTAATR